MSFLRVKVRNQGWEVARNCVAKLYVDKDWNKVRLEPT